MQETDPTSPVLKSDCLTGVQLVMGGDTIRGLSLLLILVIAPRVFFPGTNP